MSKPSAQTDQSRACYERFQHNVALAKRIEASLPSDANWSCVVMFYAAVHLMNAYLCIKSNVRLNVDDTDHRLRRVEMEKCPELGISPRKYRQLKDMSEAVRYDPGYQWSDNPHLTDAKRLLRVCVDIVEPKVKKQLG